MNFKENFYYRGNKNKIIREMFYIYFSTYLEEEHRKDRLMFWLYPVKLMGMLFCKNAFRKLE